MRVVSTHKNENSLRKVQKRDSPEKCCFLLSKRNIIDPPTLEKHLHDLRAERRGEMVDNFKKNNNTIDLFYDIFANRTAELNYNTKHPMGIYSLQCVFHPYKEIKFPLDIIFKLIHASQEYPLIKYNPGSQKEKIFRIYTDKIAQNGKKIPMLSKRTIFEYRKI